MYNVKNAIMTNKSMRNMTIIKTERSKKIKNRTYNVKNTIARTNKNMEI